ncbi:MAG: RNA-binding transcriptional accessory protein [Eubacteriales bacterium]|nr:RNA-binding transcriptional accessory protein [Eubacteriales bacterium]
MDISKILCKELGLEEWQVNAVISLSDEGCTIPFIARYRKEAHGSLDDQKIHNLIERLEYLRSLDARREEIDKAITDQGKMTDEIKAALAAAETLAALEDIYRPFKPKRRTRATVAKEKGLEPLAEKILAQGKDAPLSLAAEFINPELGVETADDALAGAKDIIAEVASDDPEIRKRLRNLYNLGGTVTVKAVDPEKDSVYTMYYDHSEPVSKIASHRVLAIDRGEKEEFLKVSVTIETDKAYKALEAVMIKNAFSPCADVVREAYIDAYSRLIAPSVEREIRAALTEVACTGAIKNFSNNLHQLLMQPPVKNKVTMGLDPGYRTGCKVAVVDGIGRVMDTGVIYITHGENQLESAKKKVSSLIAKYGVECIAIGNGTASKETEMFVSDLLRKTGSKALYMVVSEAGASVYSASKLAAEEFPDYDLTLRSAISIARRLQDPLAELVKIDPKSIGAGQYQHDMPPKQLAEALDFVVENCVNSVGVDLNTASVSLLSRVSGISSAIAKNIVAYREENGALKSRAELKKVPKLGPKAFEQAAGFLRITGGKEPLDSTAVHPESYPAAKALLKTLGYVESDISAGKLSSLRDEAEKIGLPSLAEKLGIGIPTLSDVIDELMKPGRDPRDELPPPLLRSDVLEIKDLKPGMEITGTVRNVIDFGAFVDIGVHQDGLVHISQISKTFIKHPSDVLKTGDIVKVWVISVDEAKKRIALTMIEPKKTEQ